MFAATIMVVASFAGVFVLADDASAESVSTADVTLSDNVVVTEGEVTATLLLQEQDTSLFAGASYTAKLKNSSGTTQSSAISSAQSSASIDNNSPVDITITMPKTAGDYTLEVVFTEKFSGDTENKTISVTKTIKAKDPLTLSITLENTGSLAITNATVFFYVDGVKIVDSEQKVSIKAGESEDVTYKYFDKNLSSGRHTYCLQAGESAYTIQGLGTEYEFYYEQGNYDYMVYIIVVLLILMVLFAIWVFRKPVKNYGKPKSRR